VIDVSEDQPKTVIERMVSAGINRDRAAALIADGWVRTGDEVIRDPDAVVEKYVLAPGVTEHV
jgi:hypothetical protein